MYDSTRSNNDQRILSKNIIMGFFSILCLTLIYNIYNIRNLAIVIEIDGSCNEK